MGEVCLDDGNYGEMAFRERPTHQNQLPDSCRGENITMAARFGYNRHEFESYLGNVGSDTGLYPGRSSDAPSALSEGRDLDRLTLYDQYTMVLPSLMLGRNHLGNPG